MTCGTLLALSRYAGAPTEGFSLTNADGLMNQGRFSVDAVLAT